MTRIKLSTVFLIIHSKPKQGFRLQGDLSQLPPLRELVCPDGVEHLSSPLGQPQEVAAPEEGEVQVGAQKPILTTGCVSNQCSLPLNGRKDKHIKLKQQMCGKKFDFGLISFFMCCAFQKKIFKFLSFVFSP